MKLFNIFAILISLSASFGYLNHRFIKLPTTIGVMLISLMMSLGIVILGHQGIGIEEHGMKFVRSIDFNKTLMVGMLGFLLFAGSLHVDLEELLKQKLEIVILATLGVVLSTFLVGTLTYLVTGWLGIRLNFISCLSFGALISPTDPIAVLGILREAGTPKNLETKITGESLFNDGVGIVLFIILTGIAAGEYKVSLKEVLLLFSKETMGGAALGFLLGWLSYRILKSIDNYQVEILVTLSLVTGGYALASAFNISGPIAIVVAGLLIGNHGRQFAMSDKTRQNLDTFWELVDEILNSLLFVLIGIEVLVVTLSVFYLEAGIIAILIVLLSRIVSIAIPELVLHLRRAPDYKSLKIMTWGGLRGGIAVALALSLPHGLERDVIITMTYTVVVFSIIVQGLTIKYLARRF
jgi:CPA1 family monovalent cation:H+ antiporter